MIAPLVAMLLAVTPAQGSPSAVTPAAASALAPSPAPASSASPAALGIPAPAKPSRAQWAVFDSSQRAQVLSALAHEPLGRRIARVSRDFLGTPYVLHPLGEGKGPSPEPMLRYDAVDCLTFVEETIALSLSRSPDDVLPTLNAIRYEGQPSYDDRNHLMEAEWLPSNEAKGFVRDVTLRIGGSDAVKAEKVITRTAWQYSKAAKLLNLPPARQLTGKYPLWYLPLEKLAAHAKEIPTGTIFVVVRDDAPWRITRVTHVGFVIQRRHGTYLRHARNIPAHRVVDEPLDHFIARNQRYPWKVDGVSLLEVLPHRVAPPLQAKAMP